MRERVGNFRRYSGAARGGFTIAELLLSLALASIVAVACLSLLGLLYRADVMAQGRFDDTVGLSQTYRAVRTLTRNITAMPVPDPNASLAEPGESEIAAAEAALRRQLEADGKPVQEDSLRAQALEKARNDSKQAKEQRGDERQYVPPRFEIRLEASGSGGAMPVLEASLIEAPVPPPFDADDDERAAALEATMIRGVIEGVRLEGSPGWGLQWRPTSPPGKPVLIASGLAGWEWKALPRAKHGEQWNDVAAAWYDEDYPTAVRLVMLTLNGQQVDWMFEVSRPIIVVKDDAVGEEPAAEDELETETPRRATLEESGEEGGTK